MAYTINKFNGQELIVLEDGTIDTSTSIGLVGRNYVGYGETQNENFVFLLENFANDAPPNRPLKGQTWFDSSQNTLHVYDGVQWVVVGSADISNDPPQETTLGSLWLKTPENTLNVWNGTEWRFIGPEAVPGFGTTRARSGTLRDAINTIHPVIFLEVNSTVIGICSSQSFEINANNAVSGFNTLVAGVTLSSLTTFKGNLEGNASSSTRLETARNINGVPFDGVNDITVRASTTKSLIRGSYLTGNNFDGSLEQTWAVDATSANVIGKVVARNSAGGFAAGTITADLVGNVTGNVTTNVGTSTFNVVQANKFIGATLTGNSETTNRLAQPININGVSFDGSTNITVPASAETLTGSFINNTVTGSSLTSVGTLTNLSVSDAGIDIGNGNGLKLFDEANSQPTIKSLNSSTGLNVELVDVSQPGGVTDFTFIPSSKSLAMGGAAQPAFIPDTENNTNLGHPNAKWNRIYATELVGNAQTATLATSANNLTGGGVGSIPWQTGIGVTSMLNVGSPGQVLKSLGSNLIGWENLVFENLNPGTNVLFTRTDNGTPLSSYNSLIQTTVSVDSSSANTANKVVVRDANGNFAAGTITANLTGSASLNVLKSGDSMSGFLTLHANPINPLHAATKQYVDFTVNSLQYYDEFTNGISSPGPQSFPQRSIRGFSAYNSTDFPGNYFGGITVSGPSRVYSGQIAFNWNSEEAAPTGLYFRVNDDTSNTAAWSAWKQLATVDQLLSPLNVTYGNTQYSSSGFTNIVGSWNNDRNYFDVFPPSGKTMSNLIAFMPSIAVLYYAGTVNADDATRCTWASLGDRIRVWVQNTEQRSTPAANWIAIWS